MHGMFDHVVEMSKPSWVIAWHIAIKLTVQLHLASQTACALLETE